MSSLRNVIRWRGDPATRGRSKSAQRFQDGQSLTGCTCHKPPLPPQRGPDKSKDSPVSKVGTDDYMSIYSSIAITGFDRLLDPQAHWFRRVYWAMLIFGGIVFLSYHVSKRIEYYASNPVMISMNMEYPPRMQFPAITICNANQYRYDKTLHDFNQTGDGPIHGNTTNGERQEHNVDDELMTYLLYGDDELLKPYINSSILYTIRVPDLVYKYRHRIEDMLLDCYWDQKDCKTANFTFTKTYIDYEVCYTFNAEGELFSKASGIQYGLVIHLNPELQYYHPSTTEVGFKLMVHHPHQKPNMFSASSFISLNPGTQTYIALKLIKTTNLEKPYGKCGTRYLRYNKEYYLKTDCHYECMVNFTEEACGCTLSHMPGDKPLCEVPRYFDCTMMVLSNYSNKVRECGCPIDCQEQSYEKSVTVSNFAQQGQDIVGEHEYAAVQVFFDELRFTTVEQRQAYTWLALLSDMGGALGLMLGSCFLTVAQLIDAVIHFVMRRKKVRQLHYSIRRSIRRSMSQGPPASGSSPARRCMMTISLSNSNQLSRAADDQCCEHSPITKRSPIALPMANRLDGQCCERFCKHHGYRCPLDVRAESGIASPLYANPVAASSVCSSSALDCATISASPLHQYESEISTPLTTQQVQKYSPAWRIKTVKAPNAATKLGSSMKNRKSRNETSPPTTKMGSQFGERKQLLPLTQLQERPIQDDQVSLRRSTQEQKSLLPQQPSSSPALSTGHYCRRKYPPNAVLIPKSQLTADAVAAGSSSSSLKQTCTSCGDPIGLNTLSESNSATYYDTLPLSKNSKNGFSTSQRRRKGDTTGQSGRYSPLYFGVGSKPNNATSSTPQALKASKPLYSVPSDYLTECRR